jgi:hypothetical protein
MTEKTEGMEDFKTYMFMNTVYGSLRLLVAESEDQNTIHFSMEEGPLSDPVVYQDLYLPREKVKDLRDYLNDILK